MRIAEINAMQTETLKQELENAYKEFFNLRFRLATRQISDTSAMGKTRKKIARMQTVLRQRELAQQA